jgi:hypothetical protein
MTKSKERVENGLVSNVARKIRKYLEIVAIVVH